MSIRQVMGGGIAHAAGLQAGDVILKINGKDFAALSESEWTKMLQSSPVALTIQRDGRELEIELRRTGDDAAGG